MKQEYLCHSNPTYVQHPIYTVQSKNKILRTNKVNMNNTMKIEHLSTFIEASSPQKPRLSTKNQQTTAGSRFSLPNRSEGKMQQHIKGNIRIKIDEQLKFVEDVLSNRRYSVEARNSSVSSDERLRGPSIQRNLVQEYLQNIYSDFQIPNFNEQWAKRHQNYEDKLQFLKTQPLSEITSYFQNQHNDYPKPQRVPKNSAYSLKSKLIKELAPIQSQNLKKKWRMDAKKQAMETATVRQIPVVFRYCFICQQPILEQNISGHERERCKKLKQIYSMDISQIKQRLLNKINRIRKECLKLNNNILSTKNKQNEKQNTFKIINKYLQISNLNLENKMGNIEEIKNNLHRSFQQVSHAFETNYIMLYDNLRKLQWFNYMLLNLDNHMHVHSSAYTTKAA